jgi:hypothetical protein
MKRHFLLIICLIYWTIPQSIAQKNVGPQARSGYSLAYDENRGVVVLFGGQDTASVSLSDTWEWANGVWTNLNIKGPSARINASMAYDTLMKRVVLFGGRTKLGLQDDLWVFDGRNWVKFNTLNAPPVRQLGTMVFDKSLSQLVLFGGMDASKNTLGDTWVLKDSNWVQLNGKGPTPRASHCMTYNNNLGAVFIYGGYIDGNGVNELWELKNGVWHDLTNKSGPGRIHASISYDPDKRRMLLFGGFNEQGRTNELWEYSDQIKEWSIIRVENREIPTPRAEHRSIFIPRQGLFVFGGVIGVDPNTRNRANDTWLYKETGWTKLR